MVCGRPVRAPRTYGTAAALYGCVSRVNPACHVEPGGLVPSDTKVELMPTIAPFAIISLELPANSSGVAWKHASVLSYCRYYELLAAHYVLLASARPTYYAAWKHASVSSACNGHSRYW